MFSWFKIKKSEDGGALAIGQKWRLKPEADNPWAKRYDPVIIVDIKDGWVKYDMNYFKGETDKISAFLRMYERVEEDV